MYKKKWVLLKAYCQESGETPDSFRSKQRAGLLADGKHYKVVRRRTWVNREEMDKWVENYHAA